MSSANPISAREFSELFSRYKDKYISIAASYVRNPNIAADIVSEVFTAFWENRNKIELSTVPEAYILQSVKNRCLNHLRDIATQMRIRQQIHSDAYKLLMTDIEFLSSEDLSFLFESEITKILKDYINSLPELKREIFIDSRFLGLTYNEIAEKHGVTSRKVKRDISNILSNLRDILGDYLPVIMIFFSKII